MVNDSYPTKRRGRWKECCVLFVILSIALAVALVVVVVMRNNKELVERGLCASGDENIDIAELETPPLFGDLTTSELKAVRDYLHRQPDLTLSKPSDATINSTYIYLVELLLPTKADALEHLDKNTAQPQRWAKTVLFRGNLSPPEIQEYAVGPLPNPTTHRKLLPPGKNFIPFAYRPITFTEFGALVNHIFVGEVEKKCKQLMLESFGASFVDCGNKCLTFYPTPVSTSNYGRETRNSWFWINHNLDYFCLHPLDFKILVNFDGADPSQFKIIKVWYNQVLFNSLDELVTAYDTGTVEKLKVPFPQDDTNLFSTLNLRGDPFPKRHLRSPVQVEPDGKRYSVKGQHIEYMGWSFDYRMSTTTGPMVFDVRYNGERIAYEISLQEISVYYSAYNPAHRFADFVDSVALVGALSKTLIPGFDCPDHSTFLAARHILEHQFEPVTYENALCLFEQATGVPLRRHHSYGPYAGHFYGGMMDDVLILRTALTVVNYDYIFDFIFHQNGIIEIKAISTGYILPSVYSSSEDNYGFRLHDNIVGNVHHHMFNFKVDLDILGPSNRFETLDLGVENFDNRNYTSYGPAQTYPQINFKRMLKSTELAAAYKFNFDSPKYLTFHNEGGKTKYGVPRSYRLNINGMSKQTLPEGKGAENSITWARYQMAVTKYKESELRSSSLYAIWDAPDPITRFQSFIDDDENIVDQDLVAWVTMGVHHIPHTEDLPVTPTPGGHLQFFLLPYNYFTEDPSMASQNAMYMAVDPETDYNNIHVDIKRYGYGKEKSCAAKTPDFDAEVEENPSVVFSTDPNVG